MTPAEQSVILGVIATLQQLVTGTPAATSTEPQPTISQPVSPPSVQVSGPVINLSVPMTGERVGTGGFGAGMTVIAELKVPLDAKSGANTIALYEYIGAPTTRRAWISKQKGDMSATAVPFFLQSDGPVFDFTINQYTPGKVNMMPGETWYIMIKNEASFFGGPLKSSCTSGFCDIAIKWYPPN